ncbi:MAG: hypothetical protein FWC69_01105 [Defluviitaleaceae bacterium]|nr:hypothetical protein [Defluviitaleaceae bacterium]
MIDFQKELKKYAPVLEIDNIEGEIAQVGDVEDIVELLQHLSAKNNARGNADED